MSTQPLTHGTVPQRLAHTRELMSREGIHALLVPSADPHLSEYLPGYWQGRQWLSGFHGSVGTLIVTADFAGVWADSRYWEQATKELKGSGIDLVKLQPGQPGPLEWLAEQTPEGGVVAVDGAVMAVASARTLGAKLAERGARLRTDIDLLDEVWQERPTLPNQPIYQHLPPQATVSRGEKLSALRASLKEKGADWHFIATLDDIAWLFNLRGGDVSFNPVFVSFALINQQQATLFVALARRLMLCLAHVRCAECSSCRWPLRLRQAPCPATKLCGYRTLLSWRSLQVQAVQARKRSVGHLLLPLHGRPWTACLRLQSCQPLAVHFLKPICGAS